MASAWLPEEKPSASAKAEPKVAAARLEARAEATPPQWLSGLLPVFNFFWEGFPFKVNQPKKDVLF